MGISERFQSFASEVSQANEETIEAVLKGYKDVFLKYSFFKMDEEEKEAFTDLYFGNDEVFAELDDFQTRLLDKYAVGKLEEYLAEHAPDVNKDDINKFLMTHKDKISTAFVLQAGIKKEKEPGGILNPTNEI